jgi:hypothetical protein
MAISRNVPVGYVAAVGSPDRNTLLAALAGVVVTVVEPVVPASLPRSRTAVGQWLARP